MSARADIDRHLQWRALNVWSAQRLWERWHQKLGPEHRDPLLEYQVGDEVDPRVATPLECPISTWRVGSEQDLIRLIGALQHVNPRLQLWLRGTTHHEPYCGHLIVPRRGREKFSGKAGEELLREQLAALQGQASRHRMIRNRGPLARLALLQHYGGATSFLDVTRDLRTALFFASRRVEIISGRPEPRPSATRWIQIFALPRTLDSVNDFPEVGLCVVDLSAEMPSYCLRPHAQQAGFIAWRRSARIDLACGAHDPTFSTPDKRALGGPGPVRLDEACLALVRIDFEPAGLDEAAATLFPPASRSCAGCAPAGGPEVRDYSADTALHMLHCGRIRAIPDLHWEAEASSDAEDLA